MKALAKAGWTTSGRAKAHAVPLQTSLPLYDITLSSLFGASESGGERGALLCGSATAEKKDDKVLSHLGGQWQRFQEESLLGQVLNNPAHISGATLKASFIQSRKVNPSQWD